MNLALYLRLAARESRRGLGRIGLFIACIAIGVAAVVVVAGLSNSVTSGVRTEGRRLMAADVLVEGRRPLPPELDQIISGFDVPVQRTDVREFVSVVLVPGREDASQLAEIKVIGPGYPFYGKLLLDPQRPVAQQLSPETAVVAPELLARLGIDVGGELLIGGARFRVAGKVLEEPDKLAITLTLGPRIFLSPEGVARTALLDQGARIEHRALLKLPAGASAANAERLKGRIEAELPGIEYFRARTFNEAQPALRRGFDRVERYLGLVGLLSLLVGGIGVAQVARAWLAGRMDDIAVMRCLGVTPRQVVLLFVLQVVVLALLGSAVGAVIGTSLQWLIPKMLAGLLPEELIQPWQPMAVARGVALGVFVALLFTLPILLGLRRVPPVRVLRRDAEPIREGRGERAVAALVLVGGIWLAAAWQAESFRHGSLFTGGLLAAVVALWLSAAGVGQLVRRLPRDAGGLRLRHGLAQLARPGAATVGAIVALGLGVTFVFATRIVERHLSEQLRAELPADAPSTFLLDVQPDQWPDLQAMLTREGASGVTSQPIVTARFTAIDGRPVSEITRQRQTVPTGVAREDVRDGRPRANWTLTREQRITYGAELPRGNRVVAGTFPDPARPNGVSIEEGFARDLGVGVGSTLTLDVQGVPVDLAVTSLRTIDWRTFGINFFLFATAPGPLDEAPQQRVAVAQIPRADTARVQAKVVAAFPNVTVIQIRDVMEKVLAVLGNLALAVRSLGLFIVIAGAVVLGGTIAASQARRAREVALLKAIGMTRRDVVAILAIEYALIGLVAALIGVAAALMLAWAVLTQMMQLPWSPLPGEIAAALLLTIALAVGAGLFASLRALRVRPVEALRAD